jgi:two-component sensor histidine kinase
LTWAAPTAPRSAGSSSRRSDDIAVGANSLRLTLCLHELGALSNGGGQVHIAWQRSEDAAPSKVRLSWQETGGPLVITPKRKGFGSLLIESSFAGEGETSIEYPPEGLRCTLELPL